MLLLEANAQAYGVFSIGYASDYSLNVAEFHPNRSGIRGFGVRFPSISMSSLPRMRRNLWKLAATSSSVSSPSHLSPSDKDKAGDGHRKSPEMRTLLRRFWKVAAPYWFSADKVQARLQLSAVFALN